jgi:hypothetical protein
VTAAPMPINDYGEVVKLEACDSPQRRRDAEGSAELMPRRVPVVECAGKPEKNAPTNGGMAALEGYSTVRRRRINELEMGFWGEDITLRRKKRKRRERRGWLGAGWQIGGLCDRSGGFNHRERK